MSFEYVKEESNKVKHDFSTSENNPSKNRYGDVLATERSIVKLSSGYINANFVLNDVIATQAPMENTVTDFWQMIYDYNIDKIVMLTGLFENGVTKCEKYWAYPSVKVIDKVVKSSYIVRSILLKNRVITHYQFLAWPDNGVPIDVNSFINFVKLFNNERIVVHCSAGIGRSGVFIAVYHYMMMLRNGKIVVEPTEEYLANLVLRLRENRHGMIQTKRQYEFIFTVISMMFESNLKE